MIEVGRFDEEGFAIAPALFARDELRHITAIFDTDHPTRKGGARDVIDFLPDLRDLAEHIAILDLVTTILDVDAFLVRATLFNKTPQANWKVPWHQDITIAVKERRDTPGYGPWSIKANIAHVQPPAAILEQMLTVRIHLDPCPETNGALRVMPGTHRLGRLNQNSVEPFIDEAKAVCCAAEAGDALVMRPLLLHASSASLNPRQRRILHFDYAVGDLANGLEWRMRDYSRPTLFDEPVSAI